MHPVGGFIVRAFRPSRIASADLDTEDPVDEVVKIVQILRYSERAAAQLPLFEEEAEPASLLAMAAEEEKRAARQS
jgi:hypothetical protein